MARNITGVHNRILALVGDGLPTSVVPVNRLQSTVHENLVVYCPLVRSSGLGWGLCLLVGINKRGLPVHCFVWARRILYYARRLLSICYWK